jgi:hypothetical protein
LDAALPRRNRHGASSWTERRYRFRHGGPLAQLAAPGAVVAVLLPCHSDPRDERDALLVARQF